MAVVEMKSGAGTNVMISKIFSPKNLAKILAISTQITVLFSMVFMRKK
jgi:hypothetical protein